MSRQQKIRGLVGQNLGGAKSFADARIFVRGAHRLQNTSISPLSGSITVPEACDALIYLWGGGGAGTPAGSGGAGAGALFKRVRLARGQTLAYSLGGVGLNSAGGSGIPGGDGQDSTVTLPSGVVLTAGGGGGNGGTPGLARGGDVNRRGGYNGTIAEFGGANGSGGSYGGGGAAGFSDLIGNLLVGGAGRPASTGGQGVPGGVPGGGSGGTTDNSVTGVGGASQLVVLFIDAK